MQSNLLDLSLNCAERSRECQIFRSNAHGGMEEITVLDREVKCRSHRASDRLRPPYDQLRINFPRSVDGSDCVGAQAYLCRCWARMSHVLIISNR